MACRGTVVRVILLLAIGLVPEGQAAHEWRAAWVSPYPVPVVQDRVRISADGVRAALSIWRPFGIRDLLFQQALIRSDGGVWEAHAGMLRSPVYREWHAGVGRRVAVGRGTRLLCGVRLFSVAAGLEVLAPQVAFSLIGEVTPQQLRFLTVEVGIVDVGFSSEEDCPATLLLTRALLSGGGQRLLLERSVSPDGGAETTLALSFMAGSLCLTQAFRCAVGEGSLSVARRCGPGEICVAQCWHPELGWSSGVSIAWLTGD